jgi:hypothetical protein
MNSDRSIKHAPYRNLFLLSDDVIHLNHGSFGAWPRPVFEP